MRFIGIDVAGETHVVAGVDEGGEVVVRPTSFTEDAAGYERLYGLLGEPSAVWVAMEATGHYWKNLFASLVTRGFTVSLVNPLRTRRHAEEDLVRTKTDAIDALGIARFTREKRPVPTRLADEATEELGELVGLRDRLVQDFGDRVRQLHRLVDLGFPEFTRSVKTLDSQLATAILREYPTAEAFQGIRPRKLANLRYDGQHTVGLELATAIVEAARASVGRHHGHPYRLQVRFVCQDLEVLRARIREVERDIERKLSEHDVGSLLTAIDGIGPQTAARLIAKLGGDASRFESAKKFTAYVGVIPGLRHSGNRRPIRAALTPIGDAWLRRSLWMPTLTAVRRNAWLRAHYERLIARGKLPKVALVACMRKLLTAVYSVVKNRRPFLPHPPIAPVNP